MCKINNLDNTENQIQSDTNQRINRTEKDSINDDLSKNPCFLSSLISGKYKNTSLHTVYHFIGLLSIHLTKL